MQAANDNWEDAAEQGVTPPVQGGAPGADEAASGRRVYTRDFLRSLARCYDRPAELEECAYARELLLDAPRAFDMQDVTFDMSSMGAGIRRGPGGGGGGGGRPGDDWGARRGPGGNQYQPQVRWDTPAFNRMHDSLLVLCHAYCCFLSAHICLGGTCCKSKSERVRH